SGGAGSSYAVAQKAPLFVQPNETTTLDVALVPSAVGDQTARLDLTTDDPTAPNAHVNLTGVGVSTAISATPTTVDFGASKINSASAPQSVTLTNLTNDAMQLNSAQVTGTNATDFT